MDLTQGHLLGGRIHYTQPAHGFRSGIEPVFLAAAIPLRPGESVLEGGSGAGATLLCATERVPAATGCGVERDTDLARLAQANARANGRIGLTYVAADVLALPFDCGFDHVCANPPYHPDSGTRSPVVRRDEAKRAPQGLIPAWVRALSRPLRHRGTLTFILPAALLVECSRAMEDSGCTPDAIFPLWPKAGVLARLVLIQAVKGGRGTPRLLAGLVLHDPNGAFTGEAESILRGGEGLPLARDQRSSTLG